MNTALRNVALTALLAVASAVTSGALSLTDATALQPARAGAEPERARAEARIAAAHVNEFRTAETAARRDDEGANGRDESCCAIELDDWPSHAR